MLYASGLIFAKKIIMKEHTHSRSKVLMALLGAWIVLALSACSTEQNQQEQLNQDNNKSIEQAKITQTFKQGQNTTLDLLLVLDNSLSMQPHLSLITTRLMDLFHHLQENDVPFCLAVLDTYLHVAMDAYFNVVPDGLGLPARRVVCSNETSIFDAVAQQLMNQSLYGEGLTTIERALDVMYTATTNAQIRDFNDNFGFFRPDSDLAFIFVTDEDSNNQSQSWTWYSNLVERNYSATVGYTNQNVPSNLIEFSKASNQHDLVDFSTLQSSQAFISAFENLNHYEFFRTHFKLDHMACSNGIKVFINGAPVQSSDFLFDQNSNKVSLLNAFNTQQGDTITIEYKPLQVGQTC